MNKIEVSVPFTWEWSKNKMWKTARNGRTYLNPDTKILLSTLEIAVKYQLSKQNIKIKKEKIYLSIYAELENHRGDAINLIDTLCDAIKKGLGVDDRWFCIKSLDWEIKKSGKIRITIEQ